uniref:hypothetical protein n=1 Tax=Streptococcus thermophilus TaxID=1308 RepID=UPI001459A46B|nr:hypothetical protein [Streptococcus thermophilus]
MDIQKLNFKTVQKLDGINTNNINTNISILSNQQQEEVDEIRKSYDMFLKLFRSNEKMHLFNKTSLQILMNLGNELYQYALKLAMTNVGIKRPNYKTVRKLK